MQSVAAATHAPLIVGGIGMERSNQDRGPDQTWNDYNSAFIIDADGERVGRYDKIHLVPFGEYIPFQNLLTFAHKLTGRVGLFTRGTERNSFCCPRRAAEIIATASSSATRLSSPTRCASSRATAQRFSSTSATTDGMATPALPGST
jgi:predicted amidohydrolase